MSSQLGGTTQRVVREPWRHHQNDSHIETSQGQIRFPSYGSRLGGTRTVFIDDYNKILEVDHPQTGREAERAVGWIVVTVV